MKTQPKLDISVDQIEEAAQPWDAELPRELLDEVLAGPPATEFKADGQANVHARLTKMGRKVLVQGKFTMPLKGICKRCLKPLSLDAPAEFTLHYVPRDAEAVAAKKKRDDDEAKGGDKKKRREDDEAAGSFEPALADEEMYAGKTIDLGLALREQVLLALPPSPLCKEDCKGLCPKCGKDLNDGECGCDRTVADPRWAALKQVQLDKKE